MEPKRKRYKCRSSHSEVLLKIAVPKTSIKSLKNIGEKTAFLIKSQAREDRISVPTFALPLALRAKER